MSGPSAAPTNDWSLIYVADPMCSWCYGFAPSLAAVRERWPALPVQLLMGGLRPAGELLDARLRASIQHHWEQVAARSGQPFSPAGLAREGWLYTTEPACRAVVTAREHWPERALDMFHAIQTGFYAQGRDTTDPETLSALAQDAGIDLELFALQFQAATSLDATRQDFATAQRLGIQGFPTLLAVRNGQAHAVAPGWLAPADLIERLERTFAA
ncbi:MAG: DsbA family protein [Methylibium sp.]|uniref:DsbA family protein n=1 Tax=Methylibium sp. TaxID=2067992 RepID=UPI0017C2B907|nr:DsbA family protein [Methylibium sp.]MBA3597823.1 DsbA family protein [Methylibium sp.]